MSDFNDMEVELDGVEEASSSFEPAPVGTHLCRLAVEDLKEIGSNGNLGWKVVGKVVEENNRGRVCEDVLFLSEKAKPRLKLALKRIGGYGDGKISAGQVREMLDGKLARLTVSEVIYNKKGEKGHDYSEAEMRQAKGNGEKDPFYGHAKLAFAGYESPTAEEVKKYGAGEARKPTDSKLPF